MHVYIWNVFRHTAVTKKLKFYHIILNKPKYSTTANRWTFQHHWKTLHKHPMITVLIMCYSNKVFKKYIIIYSGALKKIQVCCAISMTKSENVFACKEQRRKWYCRSRKQSPNVTDLNILIQHNFSFFWRRSRQVFMESHWVYSLFFHLNFEGIVLKEFQLPHHHSISLVFLIPHLFTKAQLQRRKKIKPTD